ncbi:MAG: preprotein translocase subunit YajC [Deltaproteobacteria bacterium]|nr:preprotein translocase subunit YajC [Deltaproteobacteria bacterium]
MTPTAIDSLVYYAARGAEALLAFQPTMTPGGAAPAGPAAPAGGAGGGAGLLNFIMLPAIFLFVWFFMLRPMRQQQKEQETLQKGLRKGDRVVTDSKMIGTVHEVFEKEIVIEIADKVRVRFLRESVTKKYDTTADAKPADAEKK